MSVRKYILVGALCLAGAAFAATAQAQQYPSYTYSLSQAHPYGAAPATAPSWSYDPYTSGLAACPQHSPNDSLSCSQELPPTYGQPDYWSR